MAAKAKTKAKAPADLVGQISAWKALGRSAADEAATEKIGAALEKAVKANNRELFAALARKCPVQAMQLAAGLGLADVIRALAAAGAKAHQPHAVPSPLYEAAAGGHEAAALALLDSGARLVEETFGDNALAIAIARRHADVARAILERTKKLNVVTGFGGSLLHAVVYSGPAELVGELVARGISPDEAGTADEPPLVFAAQRGNTDVVRALLAAGASTEIPEPPDGDRGKPSRFGAALAAGSALVRAAKFGHARIVKALIEAGANPDFQDYQQMTAYDWAVKLANDAIAERLRAAMNLPDDAIDKHQLMQAARDGDVETIRRAIAAHLPLDNLETAPDRHGNFVPARTPLMWAAAEGHVGAARALFEAGGAHLKLVFGPWSEAPQSAFELAARYDRAAVLEMFLKSPLPPDGKTLARALVAAAAEGSLQTAAQLVDAGEPVDTMGGESDTPLSAAVNFGRVEMVRWLLEQGAGANQRHRKQQFGPLYGAVASLDFRRQTFDEQGREVMRPSEDEALACIQLLLEAGADLGEQGGFILCGAVRHPRALRLLLDAGADPSLPGESGKTPLHAAVGWGVPESVGMLLEAGADVNALDNVGRTPLDKAREETGKEIFDLLETAGAKRGKDTGTGRQIERERGRKKRRDDERRRAAQQADEELQPDFTKAEKSAKYKKAIKRLEEVCGAKHRRDELLSALAWCPLTARKAAALVKRHRAEFAKAGCTLFCCKQRQLRSKEEERLGILPTADQFEVIAARGTSGANYDLHTSDIIAALKKLQEAAPFHLTKVTFDQISLEFAGKIAKPKPAAKLLAEACPAIVSDEPMSRLEKRIRAGEPIMLWWD